MPHLSSNSYGKSAVRLTKVVRSSARHELYEFNVAIALAGDFARVYTHGDNTPCIPTDTMKNTVYALAKKHDFDSPESFAQILAAHFLHSFPHVATAQIDIRQNLWNRIKVANQSHDHAFMKCPALRTASVFHQRDAAPAVTSGITDLEVLKTTNSAFCDFHRDPYTTLKDAPDRIFATTIEAVWEYTQSSVLSTPSSLPDFNATFTAARQHILETFATHNGLGVQQTIYAMGETLLAKIPAIAQVSFTMPNQHRILANLAPFNMPNDNEIFVTTSEPFGLIKGTIARD